jgi:PadR family transcriptional regulator PadR
MANNTSGENRIELLPGTLDMLILRTLQWGPQHGHGVGQAIRQSSVELLQIERGSLYPALHRLEARGHDHVGMEGFTPEPAGEILPAHHGG